MKLDKALNLALEFEHKVRDHYANGAKAISDPQGSKVFATLAREEQGHVDLLNAMLAEWTHAQWPQIGLDLARRHVRLMVEFGYAVIEMLCDRADADEAQTIGDAARILANEHRQMLG